MQSKRQIDGTLEVLALAMANMPEEIRLDKRYSGLYSFIKEFIGQTQLLENSIDDNISDASHVLRTPGYNSDHVNSVRVDKETEIEVTNDSDSDVESDIESDIESDSDSDLPKFIFKPLQSTTQIPCPFCEQKIKGVKGLRKHVNNSHKKKLDKKFDNLDDPKVKCLLKLGNGEECDFRSTKDQFYRHLQNCHDVSKPKGSELRGFVSYNSGKDYQVVLLDKNEPDPVDPDSEEVENDSNIFTIKESFMQKGSRQKGKKAKSFKVSIKKSTIEEAGDGLYYEGEDEIKIDTVFGPYKGEKFTDEEYNKRNEKEGYDPNDRLYAVCVRRGVKNPVWYDPGVEGDFEGKEYPLAKINMASSFDGVNVMFQEYGDKMFFIVVKPIRKGEEFMTCYGGEYGNLLGLDMSNFYPPGCRFDHSARKPQEEPLRKKRKIGQN